MSEKGTKDDVGEYQQSQDIDKPAQKPRPVIHQRVTDEFTTRGQASDLFTAEDGDKIFVLPVRTKDVPVHHGEEGVCRDQDRYQDKWQPPDLYVVGQKHHNRPKQDQGQPPMGCIQARRVISRFGNGQAHHFGIFDFRLQRFGDKSRTVSGRNIDEADSFQFHQIAKGNHRSRKDQRTIQKQTEPAFDLAAILETSPY